MHIFRREGGLWRSLRGWSRSESGELLQPKIGPLILKEHAEGCARSGIPGGLRASRPASKTPGGVKLRESDGFEGAAVFQALGKAGNSPWPRANPSL